jgi:hypothetical protein
VGVHVSEAVDLGSLNHTINLLTDSIEKAEKCSMVAAKEAQRVQADVDAASHQISSLSDLETCFSIITGCTQTLSETVYNQPVGLHL